MSLTGFFAYPCHNQLLIETIRNSVDQVRQRGGGITLETWEEMDIPGRFISNEILSNIESCDFLVADITFLNFNVAYEIGYAIGKGKRIVLVRNNTIQQESPTIQEVGIFDTLGYKQYANSYELSEYIQTVKDVLPLNLTAKLNTKSPIYVVRPKAKTDYDGYIVASIKKSHLYFRSFDPTETPRLAAPTAIENVTESLGIVIHFISRDLVDSAIHNLRSAFVAGLADGMGKQSVFIQSADNPVPIDYRDLVTHCQYQDQFKEAIGKLAERVIEELQANHPLKINSATTVLEEIDLGASAAENEITSLAEYYLEIDAFRRASRKEVRLVTGRKGSGKTAIFYRLRDTARSRRQNVVLDLKPEGYQLLKLKDSVVKLMSAGTVEHTVTAFWEYLLWLEVCYKLLEKDQDLHKRDHNLFEPYQRLKAAYNTDAYSSQGDFAERLKVLLRDIVADIEAKYSSGSGIELTAAEITGLVYRHDFTKLKTLIQDYLEFKEELWLLFDNIDKGWTSQGVNSEDLVIVRALMEATRKIERDLQRKHITAHTVVFLRNDIFEHLVNTTADRGKETRANVDWDDADLLRELIRRRISRTLAGAEDADFSIVWSSICTPLVDGQDSAQYLIDRCLMRPRSLLDLIGHCRGYAVNLKHEKITKEDIAKGFNAFSNDLVSELDLEIRDVFPTAENVLYAFIGAPAKLNRDNLLGILRAHGIEDDQLEPLIEMLFWFGFLGFIWTDGEPRYIYSFHYNMKVLEGSHRQMLNKQITYVLNPAFEPALGFS